MPSPSLDQLFSSSTTVRSLAPRYMLLETKFLRLHRCPLRPIIPHALLPTQRFLRAPTPIVHQRTPWRLRQVSPYPTLFPLFSLNTNDIAASEQQPNSSPSSHSYPSLSSLAIPPAPLSGRAIWRGSILRGEILSILISRDNSRVVRRR